MPVGASPQSAAPDESLHMEDKPSVSITPPNDETKQPLGHGSTSVSSTCLSPALSSGFCGCSSNEISLGTPTSTPRCATLPGSSATPPRSLIGRLRSEPNPFSYQHTAIVPGLESVDGILRHKATRRTFQLLCSLVEPKMHSPNWCEPLLHRRRQRTQGQIGSEPSTMINTDVTDCGDSRGIAADAAYPGDATPQPSALDEQPAPLSPRQNQRPVLSDESTLPENISLEVKEAARKLVDFFEERYSEKVGSLLDDALHVGTASEPSSSISSCGAATPSDEGHSPSSRPSSPEMMLSLARLHYRTVLHELFAQQINWGRIIAMFSFLRALCQTLESSPLDPTTPPRWTAETTREMYDAPIPSTDATYSVDQTDACYLSPLTNEGPRPEDKLPSLRSDNDAGDRAIVGRLDRRAVHYIIWTTEYIHEDRNLWNWIVNHNNWEGLVAFEAGADDNLQSQFLRALVSIGGVILGTLGIAAALRFVTRRL
ncbi:hypothetical protein SprV_0902651900 [Sparganum proliferum]